MLLDAAELLSSGSYFEPSLKDVGILSADPLPMGYPEVLARIDETFLMLYACRNRPPEI